MSVNKKQDPLYRAWRLLALACVVGVLGVAFFFMHSEGNVSSEVRVPKVTPAVQNNAPSYIAGPEPSVFTTFVYNPAKPTLVLSGTCKDAYYSILIYAKQIDYRKSALDARYNVATPCPHGKRYEVVLSLSTLPLVAGGTYYVIHAQQGVSGAWYDPI